MLKLLVLLIFVTFGSHLATTDDYNVKLLQFINHEIRINDWLENKRECILEKLGVVDENVEHIHYEFDLSSEAIRTAANLCVNASIVTDLKRIIHFKDPIFEEHIDCFKLKYINYDNNSILLRNFQSTLSEENCKDTVRIYEEKYSQSYFQSFQNSNKERYHIEICSAEELFPMFNVEKVTISMIIVANDDAMSEDDLTLVKDEISRSANDMRENVLSCLIKEMKAGNFGINST